MDIEPPPQSQSPPQDQEQEQGGGKQDDGKDDGEGDAYLLRAIDHLLTLDAGNGDADDRRDGEEGAEERLLSALLLATRLGSADDRRRLLLNSSHDDNHHGGSEEGGPALGWFALALVRQYVQDQVGSASAGEHVGEEQDGEAGAEDVSLALLRLAVRSVSLLYAEMPPSASVPAPAASCPTKDFHSTCMGLLQQVLQRRSEQELAIHQVDVEAAATLTLMDQKGMVDMSVGDRGIRCAEVMLRRYRSSMTRIAPSSSHDDGGTAASKVKADVDTELEQPNADAMMVQLIQSVLGESASSVTRDDETETNQGGGLQRQYAQIVSHFISALLDRGEESDAFFVSEEMFSGLLELATPRKHATLASQNTAIFLPVALQCIVVGADLGRRGIRTSPGFELVHNISAGEAGSINEKVASAILRLLLSSIAWPDNDLASRENIYRTVTALSGACGLRWMANVSVVDETSTESDLGAAAACCTLIRLSAGELRIALGWVLGDDDDRNAKEDPRTSRIYMNIVKDCLSICQAALRLMLDLSEGLDDEDFHLPTDFGPFAILHVRHSILDALDSTIQYLIEKPHERTSSIGRFYCTWDFCSDPFKGTAHGLRLIGIQCSSFLYAYVSETDIFEDEESGLSENAPSPGKILAAMKVGLQLANGIGLKQNELKIFGHIYGENDFITPLLPGIAGILSPFVSDDDVQGLGARTKAIEEALFSDSVLSDSIVATLLRLTVGVEKEMDANSGPEYERVPSHLASLDLCALVLDGIISFHMKTMPFGLAEMANQQTHLLTALSQSIFILLEGIESFPKVIHDHTDELMRYAAVQSLDRLVRCWNHVVSVGCADMESMAMKKAAGFVTLAELAVEARSEYLH